MVVFDGPDALPRIGRSQGATGRHSCLSARITRAEDGASACSLGLPIEHGSERRPWLLGSLAVPQRRSTVVPGTSSRAGILRTDQAANWEGAGLGLDRWAVESASRAKSYPRDTRGDDSVSSCKVPLPRRKKLSDIELSKLSESCHACDGSGSRMGARRMEERSLEQSPRSVPGRTSLFPGLGGRSWWLRLRAAPTSVRRVRRELGLVLLVLPERWLEADRVKGDSRVSCSSRALIVGATAARYRCPSASQVSRLPPPEPRRRTTGCGSSIRASPRCPATRDLRLGKDFHRARVGRV